MKRLPYEVKSLNRSPDFDENLCGESLWSKKILVFSHFLPRDAPFGCHIGLCVIFGIIFDFSTANIGPSVHFEENFA